MKKLLLSSSLFFLLGFIVNAQDQINMVWCGIKEAGNFETVSLSADCISETPRFWTREKGDLRCLAFKMAFVQAEETTVFTSFNGELTESMKAAFKTKEACNQVNFYDVILMTSEGETILNDRVYKVRYKLNN